VSSTGARKILPNYRGFVSRSWFTTRRPEIARLAAAVAARHRFDLWYRYISSPRARGRQTCTDRHGFDSLKRHILFPLVGED